jgi:hypothetical protein
MIDLRDGQIKERPKIHKGSADIGIPPTSVCQKQEENNKAQT